MAELKLPSETITLPSKGYLYPSDNPLASGSIELRYMRAKDEDILTNRNYIANGTVFDKLLQSLIITKINFNDLLIGDKNAILVASRVLGYGKDYSFTYQGKTVSVDLSKVKDKELDPIIIGSQGINNFEYEMPTTQDKITFKFLSHGDEMAIDKEILGMKKLDPEGSFQISTRLKFMITSVEGKKDQGSIRDFVDNYLLAKDSRAFREYYSKLQPDIDLKYYPEEDGIVDYTAEGISIPINYNFFWPESGI